MLRRQVYAFIPYEKACRKSFHTGTGIRILMQQGMPVVLKAKVSLYCLPLLAPSGSGSRDTPPLWDNLHSTQVHTSTLYRYFSNQTIQFKRP